MIPSGRLNGYSVNTLRDVLVSSTDADSTIITAWLGGVDFRAFSIAYSSPVWFDWSGPGTLRLAFLRSLSLYHTPLPARAVVSPLLVHEPSVYIISGGLSRFAVTGGKGALTQGIH